MPHVSKKFIQREVYRKINSGLIFYLSKLSDGDSKLVANHLLTKTEKLMLAKRMAIICLLADKTPQNEIFHVLKVSPSTVARINNYLEVGRYDPFINMVRKKKRQILWTKLAKILRGGLPPRGVRWKHYNNDVF